MFAKGLSMIDSAGAQALSAAERAANMVQVESEKQPGAPAAAHASTPVGAMPIAVPGDMPVATPVGVADPPPQQPSGYAMPTGNMIDRLANKVNNMAD